MDEQAKSEWDAEKVVRTIYLGVLLVITIGQVVYLIDTRQGERPSTIARIARVKWAQVDQWWRKVTIRSEARRHAPEVIWEAWQAMEGS